MQWKAKLEEAGIDKWQASATYERAGKWHNTQQEKLRGQAFAASRKEKAVAMTDPKKGAKVISKALNPAPASPMIFARRDKVGPKGGANRKYRNQPF